MKLDKDQLSYMRPINVEEDDEMSAPSPPPQKKKKLLQNLSFWPAVSAYFNLRTLKPNRTLVAMLFLSGERNEEGG